MFSRFSLVNPYPTPSGRMDGAAARRGRPSRKLSGNRLSQRVRVKHGSFSLPQPLPSTSYPRSPLMVFSFSTSSYFHVPTQCVAYEATNVGTLDETQTREGEGERFRLSRGEALCIGNFKSQPGNNSYVWIDSYYYKAYVGRACGTSRVCVPHRDRLAWLADRPAVWPQLPPIFAISLSPPLLAAL